jgi:hypothetical protein
VERPKTQIDIGQHLVRPNFIVFFDIKFYLLSDEHNFRIEQA